MDKIKNKKKNLKSSLFLFLIMFNVFLFYGVVFDRTGVQMVIAQDSGQPGDADISCFLPGTKITMADNTLKSIEDVEVGDKIYTFDENLNPIISEVLELEAPVRNDYYNLYMENGIKLNVTNEHPLFIKSGDYEGWGAIMPEIALLDSGIKTKKIEVGDFLLNSDKEWIEILDIKHINKQVQTYNLKSVSKSHTFFAQGFLTHNKNGGTFCGDGICNELASTCPQDCGGSICGNGICESGESNTNCPADCPGADTTSDRSSEPVLPAATPPPALDPVSSGTYYCASDNTFTTDLDIKDEQTCAAAGFVWTGSLCCSEADDPNEYYNDLNGIGGCWNKETVLTFDLVPGREDVVNIDGSFFGCQVTDQNTLNLRDYHTGLPLVQNKEICFQDSSRFYYCSSNGKWEISAGLDKSHLSTAPDDFPNVNQSSSCCSVAQCWDGTQCVANQKTNPFAVPIQNMICVDGEWVQAIRKFTPDRSQSGFCPNPEQCLVDPFGNSADNDNPDLDPVCISDSQYIEDDYCENGEWTSRTKLVALQLAEMADDNDFVLFCDNADSTLNKLNYLVQGQFVANLITKENTNNFCVLILGNEVILGTSFNKPVSDQEPLLNLLGIDNCNNALQFNDDQYHQCSSNNAWYNNAHQSIIYSQNPISIAQINFFDAFLKIIKAPFELIINKITGTIKAPFDTSYIDELKTFKKLYISKLGTKEIRGTLDGIDFLNLVLEYHNFDTDMCKFIDDYDLKIIGFDETRRDLSGVECSQDQNTYYALAQGSALDFTNLNPEEIWNDLTSKLRVS